MSKLRVDKIQNQRQQDAATQTERVKPRTELHTQSTFNAEGPATFAGIGRPDLSAIKQGSDKPRAARAPAPLTYRMADGTELTLPQLSLQDQAASEKLLSSAGDGREKLERAATELGEAAYNETQSYPPDVAITEASAGLQQSADNAYEVYMTSTGQQQRDQASNQALLMGMWGPQTALQNFFHKVVGRDALSGEVRSDVAELKDMLADWPDDGSTQTFSYHEVIENPDGTVTVVEHNNVQLTKAEAEALLERMQGQVETLGSIATRDQFKLQYMVQRNQQAINTLSNILKNQDETRKGIIGNVKA